MTLSTSCFCCFLQRKYSDRLRSAAEILGWSAAAERSNSGNSAGGLLSSAVSGVWLELRSKFGTLLGRPGDIQKLDWQKPDWL
jgi:hypothetical protein